MKFLLVAALCGLATPILCKSIRQPARLIGVQYCRQASSQCLHS